MIILPIRHENMTANRWPVITLGLIAINTIVFLATSNAKLEQHAAELNTARTHIRLLAAMHPELTVPAEIQPVIDTFKEKHPGEWQLMQEWKSDPVDPWDAHMRLEQEVGPLQQEMDSLAADYARLSTSSTEEEGYAFVPAHHRAITYITANFMHGGWLHLIGNMWFLWLAGFMLEDSWGRIIYSIFYLAAGAAALQIFAFTEPGSLTPVLGASGAVAGLMGAFLVRFPTMKLHMRWFIGLRSLTRGGYEFKAPAYAMLPLWLLGEFYDQMRGVSDGVAHWAHVGGFAFGAAVALLIRFTGLEQKANEAITSKTTWTNDAEITTATEFLDKGQLDDAENLLKPYFEARPDSFDAAHILQQVYWRKGRIAEYHELTLKLCALHLKNRETEAAWQNYQEFINSGGENVPVQLWFDLCRAAETQQNFEGAIKEYQKLIAAYPAERQALMAQIALGRIFTKVSQPDQAIKFYEQAAASKIPHLDMEATIEMGIREAKKGMTPAPVAR